MNDEKNPLNPASPPDVTDSETGDPWDDDDGGGRTLATAPSFEIPSDVPSPITAPPPAVVPAAPKPMASPAGVKLPAMRKPQATMMGFGPPGPALPSDRPAANMPRASLPLTGQLPTTPAFRPHGAIGPTPAPSRLSSGTRAPPLAPRPLGPAPLLPRPGFASSPPPAAAPAPPPALAAPPSARAMAPSAPAAAEHAAEHDAWPNDSDQDDGPTRAVAAPSTSSHGRSPLRDDAPDPRFTPMAAGAEYPSEETNASVDKDAETMALSGDEMRLPSMVSDESGDLDEMTRALSRDQMMREQDAHIVVGDDADAQGDEATMAFAPAELLGLAPPSAGSPFEAFRGQLGSQSDPRPAFPSSPQHFEPQEPWPADEPHDGQSHGQPSQPLGMGMQPVVPSWGAAPAPSYPNPPQEGVPSGFGPMHPPYGPPPSSPEYGAAQHAHAGQQPYGQPMNMGMQHGPGAYGPNAPANAPMPMPMPMPMAYPSAGMQPMQGSQQGWMGPPGVPAQPTGQRPQPPQLILLVAVGAVCLTIFVIGVVLFFTTRF